jgi:FkbM family methyltransferase
MNKFRKFLVIRSFIWRLGRKLYCWARQEASSGPETNGEYWLLEQVIELNTSKVPIFFDIGANKGNWSDRAVALYGRERISGRVHAFEPASETYAYLIERFKTNNGISLNKVALSDQAGIRELFVVGTLAGTNSLIRTEGANTEQVMSMRVDEYLAQAQIEHVVFVKSDTEGHDFNVLLGAVELFQQGRVDVWQFEYNHRWIDEKFYLKNVFEFIADKPYRLGKLYSNEIEVYERWHPELERFFEANYVLIRNGSSFEKLCSEVTFNERNVLVSKKSIKRDHPELVHKLGLRTNQKIDHSQSNEG